MTFIVTTDGLQEPGAVAATLADMQWAAAAGTANALTAAFPTPLTALTDGLIVGVRASAANTLTTPTLNTDSLGAHTITRGGGLALRPGDIAGLGHELLLRYNLANTRWELLNPARAIAGTDWVAAGGSADAITATYSPAALSLTDGLSLRVRASAVNATTTPTFSPNGLTAHTITKFGGGAVLAGDIAGLDHELILTYKLASTRWELLNPAISNQAASINGTLFKALAADDTGGSNVNTAQPWFPTAGGVTVKAGATYRFRGRLLSTRAAGTTSHTTAVLFAGTATLTMIVYEGDARTGDANSLAASNKFRTNAATAFVVKAASTSATEDVDVYVEGTVVINAAGTFIPQFIYSAAPGGAPTIKAGSWFEMVPMTNPMGTWA